MSEMTPMERMERMMTGLSWTDAEDVGVEVLARCLAYHAYVERVDADFFHSLMERVCRRADEWAQTDYGSHYLAMASVGRSMKEKENNEGN